MTGRSFLVLAHRHPNDLVAVGPGGTRTVGDLLADVASLAQTLASAPPGGHVAVIADDRYHFAAAVLAVWHAGHAVLLPPSRGPAAIDAVVQRIGAFAVLHDTDIRGGCDVRPLLGRAAPPATLAPVPAARQLATVFTSGSTGDFQPSVKTALQLFGEVETLQATLRLTPTDRLVATVPPHHLYGLLFGVLLPLHAGAAFNRDLPLHAEAIAARAAAGGTLLVSVPAHLRSLDLLAPGRLAGLTHVVSSTAPLPPATAATLRDHHGLHVTEILGSSETGGIAWRVPAPGEPWRPLAGVTVAASPDGRLLVSSSHIAPTLPRPVLTDDRIAMRDDGSFDHIGRSDDVVKVGGRRVSLAHLTARLRDLEGVHDAAVVAVPAPDGGRTSILAAVVAPGWTAETLRAALEPWFDRVLLPRRIALLDALPRETTGKLPRERLLALFAPPAPPAPLAPPIDLELLATHEAPPTSPDALREDRFTLRVPEDLLYFQGHFDTFPVLAAVAQLHRAVLPYAAQVRPDLGHLATASRLKFRRPIRPGDTLVLSLRHRRADPTVDFTLSRDGAVCAQGRLHFAPHP